MKLPCSVEVVRQGTDLKAEVALKTDRSVFKARRQKTNTCCLKRILADCCLTKKQEAKCQKQM